MLGHGPNGGHTPERTTGDALDRQDRRLLAEEEDNPGTTCMWRGLVVWQTWFKVICCLANS